MKFYLATGFEFVYVIIAFCFTWCNLSLLSTTTDAQWRHKSKISEKLGWCGRQNMLRPLLKIWEWEWIFGRAVKSISCLGVRSPWLTSCLIYDKLLPVESTKYSGFLWMCLFWSKSYFLGPRELGKGQIISKCLFGVFNFFQKTKENTPV